MDRQHSANNRGIESEGIRQQLERGGHRCGNRAPDQSIRGSDPQECDNRDIHRAAANRGGRSPSAGSGAAATRSAGRVAVLVLPLLLLRVLLLVIPVLPLWLLHALLLLFRFASLVLTLLMLVILSFALLLVLRISRSRDSETQGKNGGASNSKYFHKLRFQATLRNSALELDFVVRTSAGFLMVKKCKMKNYGAELDLIS
jgi:hypothetical protein